MTSWERIRQLFNAPTFRLAAIHLMIIMLMSVSFSVIFYHTSDRQFSRPIAPMATQNIPSSPFGDFAGRFDRELRNALDERFNQTRQELLLLLVWINIVTLLLGAIISYVLARWSLRPIEAAMDAQIQFVSDASHELRTPLTVLQATNEVALRKSKLSAADARELATHNVEEVKKLRDLTNTLLDLLKHTDTVAFETVNLQNVVSEAMTFVVTPAQEKNIVVEDTVPHIHAQTNHALLVRILSVLLDNAVKYSPRDTRITLSATRSGKKVLLHVTDQGIGIEDSELPLIFRRFYRADKSRGKETTHGYGLGLSIADKIARQLGANITVKSQVGTGSTFTVELPGT